MDERRINVTFTVVMVVLALFFAIAMYVTGEDIAWHHYACLALAFAIPCFVVWRI